MFNLFSKKDRYYLVYTDASFRYEYSSVCAKSKKQAYKELGRCDLIIAEFEEYEDLQIVLKALRK